MRSPSLQGAAASDAKNAAPTAMATVAAWLALLPPEWASLPSYPQRLLNQRFLSPPSGVLFVLCLCGEGGMCWYNSVKSFVHMLAIREPRQDVYASVLSGRAHDIALSLSAPWLVCVGDEWRASGGLQVSTRHGHARLARYLARRSKREGQQRFGRRETKGHPGQRPRRRRALRTTHQEGRALGG